MSKFLPHWFAAGITSPASASAGRSLAELHPGCWNKILIYKDTETFWTKTKFKDYLTF